MTTAVQVILDALSVGSLYALVALGIGLIFGIMRLINFAYGEFIMIGAYMLMLVAAQYVPVTIIVSMLIVILVSLLSDRIAFKPVRNANPTTMLVTSFAVSYFLQYLFVMLVGARPKGFTILTELAEPLVIGAVRIPKVNLLIVVLTVFLMLGLALFLRRTRFGIQMRAAALNFRMARLLGVRANRVIAVAFALSGLLAGVVAVFVVVQGGTLAPAMGVQLALIGFVATVIGGMGSLVGAVLGGYFVGVVTTLLQLWLPIELRPYREAFVFASVILVLLARPQGLFRGAESRERV
jgi:branched-chain amino acid transport system permease protein